MGRLGVLQVGLTGVGSEVSRPKRGSDRELGMGHSSTIESTRALS